MDGTGKAWYQSKTVWGSIIALLAGVGTLAGLKLDASLQDQLAQLLTGAGELVGGALAFYGRMKADKAINPTVTGVAKP